MVIGDAACLTKPINGEGIPSSWVQCTPAAKIIKEALKDDNYPIKENLWEINTLYQRNEGAAYASLRALLIGFINTSEEDNDFLFRNRIVFKDDEEEENKKIISTLIKGVINKEFSFKGFKNLIKGIINASRLEKLYKKYPINPIDYKAWKKKADKLWNKVGTMADAAIDL
jgi:flavin-dependent dehydrogenase